MREARAGGGQVRERRAGEGQVREARADERQRKMRCDPDRRSDGREGHDQIYTTNSKEYPMIKGQNQLITLPNAHTPVHRGFLL